MGRFSTLVPPADKASAAGRARGAGVVLSDHAEETFSAETEDEVLSVCLEKARRRFDGGEAQTRYRFEMVERGAVPADSGEGGPTPAG